VQHPRYGLAVIGKALFPLVLGMLLLGMADSAQAALLYPDLKTLPPRNLRFDRTDVSADSSGDLHNVLRFSNTGFNVGEGPVEIRATIDQRLSPPAGPAVQRVYDSDGGFSDFALQSSTLYYHAVHKHYHFDNWGDYQLWTKGEYDNWLASGVGGPDLVGTKTTSCVTDEEFVTQVASAVWPAAYPPSKCMPNSNNVIAQGLSGGWGDTYDYYRFEQWIDLGQSRLSDGVYVLRSIADPLNLVYESANKGDASRESASGNAATTTFTVSGGRILDGTAPTGTIAINHIDPATSSPQVSLDVLGRDDVSGVRQFKVSNDGVTWATYTNESFDSHAQTISWDVNDPTYGGNTSPGTKTVSVMFCDNTGRWGPTTTDTIDYQTRAPPPADSAYARAVQADAPVGWWRLGESSGASAADQTGAGNAGTYVGTVALRQPSLLGNDSNTAAGFSGAGSVRMPTASAFNFTSAFSLEAWIKPTALPAAGAFASILTKAESYSLQFNGPRLEFTVIQSGTRRRLQAPAGAVVAGTAYHVVGAFDGTTQRLYLNGAQVASASLTGSASVTTNPLYVAGWNSTTERFNGVVDEPAVYARTLSASQVRAHYAAAGVATLDAPSGLAGRAVSSTRIDLTWTDNASGETGQVLERSSDQFFSSTTTIPLAADAQSYSDTGLTAGTTYWYRVKAVRDASSSAYSNAVQATTLAPTTYAGTVLADHPTSYWRLDETGGTIAGDETVANPGTFLGGVTLGVPGLLANDPGTAVGFDGVSGDVRVGQSGSLDLSSALTIEAWIRPSSLPSAGSPRSIVAKPGSYALQLNGSQAELVVVQLGLRVRLAAPVGTIVAGDRYHVVGTFDGVNQRLYVNGAQVASAALGGSADVTIGGIRIGSWDGRQEFFAGTIDEAAVYNAPLSAARIAAHYGVARPSLAAPSGLSARVVSSTRIDLSWTDNASGETGQVVQRSTDSSFSAPTSISLPVGTQSYSDTGLSPSTAYWYRVRAVSATDASNWSATASATTSGAVAYATVVAADDPVSWWRLGETSGVTAMDEESLNPGTYLSGTTLGVASLLPTVTGDTAVAFDGARGAVRAADSASLDLMSAFSLEAWIKPAALPATGAWASILTKAESYSLQFNGPRLEFTLIQSGIRRRLQAPVGAVTAGNVYHVVATYDGAMQRLYLNGVQVASIARTGGATVTTNALYLGSWDGRIELFSGTLDEPAVYATTLSANAVAAHYAAGTSG
jgi:hypothetical protein